MRIEPFDPADTTVSYFIGNDPEQWHADVPVYGGVRYVNLYSGLDLEPRSQNGRWTWQLVCGHGPELIEETSGKDALRDLRLRVEGADQVEAGDSLLRLQTAVDEYVLALPAQAAMNPSLGGSWGANVRVNDDSGGEPQGSPDLAVDASGNAYAVWLDWRAGGYRPLQYSLRNFAIHGHCR